MSDDGLDDEAAHRFFADAVRNRAQRLGLPLYQLAERAEMSEVTLHRLLSGERSPRLTQILGLARALECRPRSLLP